MTPIPKLILFLLLVFSAGLYAQNGGVQLSRTRVIFSGVEAATTFSISNTSSQTWLIQTRVQNGPEDESAAPFVVTPPLSLLKGDSQQTLRILTQGASLPADRESLFYLSVMAFPAQTDPLKNDRLSVGLRMVVKLFFRPEAAGRPEDTSGCLLVFRRVAGGLKLSNPTPWYQTFGTLTLDGMSLPLDRDSSMIAPRSELLLPASGQGSQLSWQTITDYGGLSMSCQQALNKEVTP